MLNLQTVMINSEDAEALAVFYTKAFGKPMWQGDGFTGWQVGASGVMVGPHSEVKGKNTSPGRIMFGLVTEEVEDEFKRLVEAGAKPAAEPYHPNPDQDGWLATLEDPDGNYFQLMTPWEMPEA